MTDQLDLQRLGALARANEVRFARAADKRAIRRGELDPCKVLVELPEHWESARVVDLLLAIDRVGRTKAGRWCSLASVSPASRLVDVSAPLRTSSDHLGFMSLGAGASTRVRHLRGCAPCTYRNCPRA